MLALHGAHDTQVPESQSSRLVAKLREQRSPVEYILFPDEGHGFRREENRVRATLAITKLFVKHLTS
jgi:dipeptidyl aminopeptidase/acylaminoacyl peptidase